MLDRVIGNQRLTVMEKALDGAMLRQKVIANNLANVDTPGYKAVEVTFEEQLKKLIKEGQGGFPLRTSHPRHMQAVETSGLEVGMKVLDGYKYRNDGNTVDIDREMARLAKNVVYYNAVSSSISQELRILRMAITGGRG